MANLANMLKKENGRNTSGMFLSEAEEAHLQLLIGTYFILHQKSESEAYLNRKASIAAVDQYERNEKLEFTPSRFKHGITVGEILHKRAALGNAQLRWIDLLPQDTWIISPHASTPLIDDDVLDYLLTSAIPTDRARREALRTWILPSSSDTSERRSTATRNEVYEICVRFMAQQHRQYMRSTLPRTVALLQKEYNTPTDTMGVILGWLAKGYSPPVAEDVTRYKRHMLSKQDKDRMI